MDTGCNIVYDNAGGLVHNACTPAQLLRGYPDGAYTTIAMIGTTLRDLDDHVRRILRC
jgi:hypothetical protein